MEANIQRFLKHCRICVVNFFLINAQEEGLFTKEMNIAHIKEFVHKYFNEDFFQALIGDLKACCRRTPGKIQGSIIGNEYRNYVGHIFRS